MISKNNWICDCPGWRIVLGIYGKCAGCKKRRPLYTGNLTPQVFPEYIPPTPYMPLPKRIRKMKIEITQDQWLRMQRKRMKERVNEVNTLLK